MAVERTQEYLEGEGESLTFIDLSPAQANALRIMAQRYGLSLANENSMAQLELRQKPLEATVYANENEAWHAQVAAFKPVLAAYNNPKNLEAAADGTKNLVDGLTSYTRYRLKANIDLVAVRNALGEIFNRTITDFPPRGSISIRKPSGSTSYVFVIKPKPETLILTPKVASALIEGFNLQGETDEEEIAKRRHNPLISLPTITKLREEESIKKLIFEPSKIDTAQEG